VNRNELGLIKTEYPPESFFIKTLHYIFDIFDYRKIALLSRIIVRDDAIFAGLID
jgi:hypothetical protein